MSTPLADLKAKIVAIVQANPLVSVVYDYDKPNVDSTPAAIVVPSGNESDYATTASNRRTYAFQITLLVPFDAQGAESAEDTLVGIMDTLLDDFDEDGQLTGSCLMMTAAPSAWGYQGREVLYRVATINLKCDVYVNVN